MWKLLLICVVMSAFQSEAATRQGRRRRAYGGGSVGSSAGSYANSNGGGGGYVGGYTSNGNGGVYVNRGNYGNNDYDDYDNSYAPNFGIIDPYLFHQQLTNHVLQQNYATQQAITGLATAGDAYAFADATLDTDDTRIQQQINAQQAYNDNTVRQNRYRPSGGSGGGSYNVHRYAPSYAVASGSIGSKGHRQTAYISPSNPHSPNIVNRFGGSSGGGGGGGYKGVSVSSYSSSNGDGSSRRGAQTTVNDNGKVTSYSVHS